MTYLAFTQTDVTAANIPQLRLHICTRRKYVHRRSQSTKHPVALLVRPQTNKIELSDKILLSSCAQMLTALGPRGKRKLVALCFLCILHALKTNGFAQNNTFRVFLCKAIERVCPHSAVGRYFTPKLLGFKIELLALKLANFVFSLLCEIVDGVERI